MRLSLAEREEISRGLAAGLTLTAIAQGMGRSTSTVSREVARNRGPRGYRAVQADRLAEAMADHALTRPAAEQIARGDYASAVEQLREAAAQAGDLSQGSREGLAGDLDQAASIMQPETNGLEEATRDAAGGLRQGEDPAQSGMRDLADAVEQAGEEVVAQGDLASQMRNAQQAQAQQQACPTMLGQAHR